MLVLTLLSKSIVEAGVVAGEISVQLLFLRFREIADKIAKNRKQAGKTGFFFRPLP